jgi:hypothetical protein
MQEPKRYRISGVELPAEACAGEWYVLASEHDAYVEVLLDRIGFYKDLVEEAKIQLAEQRADAT